MQKTNINDPSFNKPVIFQLGKFTVTANYQFYSVPKQQIIIDTINPYSYVISRTDLEFKQALMHSDILIPDGTGIVLAARYLHGIKIKKIAGADLHLMILQQLEKTSGSIFYLGATNQILSLIQKRIHAEYPHIQVEKYSPPYCEVFSKEETNKMITAVNVFHPDVLFVGMTAPKQEKWIAANHTQLNTQVISGIGAAFGFFAGTTHRAPQWMINRGLEWLGRLVREPKRLWKRNFIYTPKFLYYLLLMKFKK